jgi:predicted ferric reductase
MEPFMGYDVNISWGYIFKIIMFLIVKLSCSIEYFNFKVIHAIVCLTVRNEMTVEQNKIL